MINFVMASAKKATPSEQNIRVYALGGQSNMEGAADPADLPVYLQGNIPGCYYFDVDTSQWVPLTATIASPINKVGPYAEFGYRMRQKYPNDLHYFIIEAVSGTSLVNDWKYPDGQQYLDFETRWNAAIATLSGLNYTKKGFLWMQGESDAAFFTFYETNQTAFVGGINGIIGVSYFIDARIHNSLPAESFPNANDVRTAKDNNFTNNVTDGLIDTDSFTLNTDSVHFDTAGQSQLGNAFAQYF